MEQNLFLYIVFIVAILGFIYTRYQTGAEERLMRHLAKARGYIYASSAPMSSVRGVLFTMGTDGQLDAVVTGPDTRIYFYRPVVGLGENRQRISYTVYERTYPYTLPHMIINEHVSVATFVDRTSPRIDQGTELTLEGHFSRRFGLQVERHLEHEALQIFTPDIMHKFLDQKAQINFETFGHTIYMYQNRAMQTNQDMDAFCATAELIDRLLSPKFKEASDDTRAMHGVKKV